MDILPEYANIIENLNEEYEELNSLNQELINGLVNILKNHVIESAELEYESPMMYDIIKHFINFESYDIIYFFKRYNINNPNIQKKILGNLLPELMKMNTELDKASPNLSSIDYCPSDLQIYLSEFDVTGNILKFKTRLLAKINANCVWGGDVEGTSEEEKAEDYSEYFEEYKLICIKTMKQINMCNCNNCNLIKKSQPAETDIHSGRL